VEARKSAMQFTMPELIRRLSKRISEVTAGQAAPEQEFEPGEKVIEAWAKKGGRVAVTTRRLIIDTAKGGRVVVVPLSQIIKIDRRYGLSRGFLAAGAIASVGFLLAKAANQTLMDYVQREIISLGNGLLPGLGGVSVQALGFLPLGISVALILLGSKRGYWVVYGANKGAFLPSEFKKAVGVVERLVPEPLLPGAEVRKLARI